MAAQSRRLTANESPRAMPGTGPSRRPARRDTGPPAEPAALMIEKAAAALRPFGALLLPLAIAPTGALQNRLLLVAQLLEAHITHARENVVHAGILAVLAL